MSHMSLKALRLVCEHCGVNFTTKRLLTNHIRIHFVCSICNLDFRNKSLLASHQALKHPELHSLQRKSKKKYKYECQACKISFVQNSQLKYHIRKDHYNLVTTAPYFDQKQLNEIWYEKVYKTNILVEIKKVKHNLLLIRRLHENTPVTATETDQNVVDLRLTYPTESSLKTIQCNTCLEMCLRKELHNHIMEKHNKRLTRRCKDCNSVFKRLTTCLNHVCPKKI